MPKKDKRAWAWAKLKECHENSTPITVRVSEAVKGGLLVHASSVGGLRGFLPSSHIELRRPEDLTVYVGQEFDVLIESLDIDKRKVVFSRRILLREGNKREASKAIRTLRVGDVLDGKVSNITDAGIFVQAGAIFGLVDWRAVSWNLELDFRDARKVGDKVSARVLKVDQARERVLFDIRDTELDPWIDFARTHHIGQLVFGRAVSVLPHCAYFELSWGVYGYAHISELTHEIPRRATEVVRPGDEMWLKIVGNDPMSKYELTASRMYPERAKSTAKSGSNHRSAFSHVNADGKPKAEFQTFVDAEMSIRDIQKTLPRGVHLYSYVCDTCQLWHFGSRTEEFWTLSKVRVESEGGEVAPEWQHTVSDDSAERLESSGDGN